MTFFLLPAPKGKEIKLFQDDSDGEDENANGDNDNSFTLDDFTNLEPNSPKLTIDMGQPESDIDDAGIPADKNVIKESDKEEKKEGDENIDTVLKELGTAESDTEDIDAVPLDIIRANEYESDKESDDSQTHAVMGVTFNEEEEEVYEPVEDAIEKVGRWTHSGGAARKPAAKSKANGSHGEQGHPKNYEAEKLAIHSESQRLIRGTFKFYHGNNAFL